MPEMVEIESDARILSEIRKMIPKGYKHLVLRKKGYLREILHPSQ